MKTRRLLLSIFVIIASVIGANAQCTTCTPNSTLFPPNPDSLAFGLTPDTIQINQGQDTSIVLQFLMPEKIDTFGQLLDVLSIQIISVDGLPSGLNWECNLSTNGCFYEPQIDRYGCVTLCGLTFSSPGVYDVTVIVTGDLGVAAGNIPIPLQMEVLPSPGGNAGFSFSPTIGCDSLSVDFEGIFPAIDPVLSPVSYDWDFGGGNTTSGNTVTNNYNTPGQHEINMTVTTHELYVSSVSVENLGDWWYYDIVPDVISGNNSTQDDAFCYGTPGNYICVVQSPSDVTLSMVSGSNSFVTDTLYNTNDTIFNTDFVLSSQSLALSFMDIDTISADDFSGMASVYVTGPGVYSYTTYLGGAPQTTGEVTVDIRPKSTQIFTDTVTVLDPSGTPTITNLSVLDTFCLGDSVILESSVSGSYQWLLNGEPVVGATDQTLVVRQAGEYSVQVIDAGLLCAALSNLYSVYTSSISASSIALTNEGDLVVQNPDEYDVQWFDNDVAIAGATSDTLSDITTGGPFTVSFTSSLGCVDFSTSLSVCVSGSASADGTTVTTSNGVTVTASGFSVTSGNTLAWAVSPESEGPVTDDVSFQQAADNDRVFLGDTDTSYSLHCGNSGVSGSGNYYVTPVLVESPDQDPVLWDTTQHCGPTINVCPGVNIDDPDWVLSPLNIQFPNGLDTSVLALAGLPELPIDAGLINSILQGELPCFDFGSLYAPFGGDPNGTWSLTATNVGTSTLVVTVPAFSVVVDADSCGLITESQVYNYDAVTTSISPGETGVISFTVPPLPEDFPSLSASCTGYGEAVLLTFDGCPVHIQDIPSTIESLSVYPNPNEGTFVLDMQLSKDEQVIVSMHDYVGQELFSYDYGTVHGAFTESFQLRDQLVPGMYLLTIRVGNRQVVQKVMIN